MYFTTLINRYIFFILKQIAYNYYNIIVVGKCDFLYHHLSHWGIEQAGKFI